MEKKIEEPRCFISVSVEKELPKEDGLYVFGGTAKLSIGENDLGLKEYMDIINFKTEKKQDSSDFDIYEYFLKPFSLPELMEEQLGWIDKNYFKFDQNAYILKYSNLPFGEAKRFTYKELTEEFLTQKGLKQ